MKIEMNRNNMKIEMNRKEVKNVDLCKMKNGDVFIFPGWYNEPCMIIDVDNKKLFSFINNRIEEFYTSNYGVILNAKLVIEE